jgi:hypothetical protein
MALNLLEKVEPQNVNGRQSGQQKADNRKRTWSSSNRGSYFQRRPQQRWKHEQWGTAGQESTVEGGGTPGKLPVQTLRQL